MVQNQFCFFPLTGDIGGFHLVYYDPSKYKIPATRALGVNTASKWALLQKFAQQKWQKGMEIVEIWKSVCEAFFQEG